MSKIKYFLQFIIIFFLFLIFKMIGIRYSSIISGKLFNFFGPNFRSRDIIYKNLSIAFPNINELQKKIIFKKMWFNYGRILAEYVFIKQFRNSQLSKNIIIENPEELEKIKNDSKPVIFISGHFNNFELMAMQIEKAGINLAAIYRPLNNIFLNPIIEKIRRNYICKKQIKKGISGTKELLKHFKKGSSIALMIDQRVSEGIEVEFFNKKALTTTIPAQFVKKYETKIVPVYIERDINNKFKMKIYKSLVFSKNETIETITKSLNKTLEKMILKNPEQWIWTHNRWK